jgi:hypothetical protein
LVAITAAVVVSPVLLVLMLTGIASIHPVVVSPVLLVLMLTGIAPRLQWSIEDSA